MSTLQQDILAVIEKNLPQATATELQKYIAQAGANVKEIDDLKKRNDSQAEIVKRAINLELREEDVKIKELTMKAKDQALQIKEEILTIREKHAQERVSEIRELTRTVFASNRLNYNVGLSMPNPGYNKPDAYGNRDYNQTSFVSGNVTKDETPAGS